MKYFFVLFVTITSFAQIKTKFTESISGAYNTVKTGTQTNLSITSQNHFETSDLFVDVNPTYNLAYSNKLLVSNEFNTKLNLGYYKNSYSYYLLGQYTSSYIRKIENDVSEGIGAGKTFDLTPNLKYSLSYCVLHEQINYLYLPNVCYYKNSFRVKITSSYVKYNIGVEYYYQPTLDFKKTFAMGTTSATMLINKNVSLLVQNTFNYSSVDAVRLIQATTIGLKINI